uniref:CARDB domain-containing protein n=1 Tax=candidate division CPR3 bacterium TaxID=2268181 RepID=A0A7C5YUW4_UNCC3
MVIPSVYSLQQISLQQIGSGELSEEVTLVIHNTGDETLNGFLMYVDDELYKENKDLVLAPNVGFQLNLELEPGDHKIVCQLGDAQSSIDVYIAPKIKATEKTIENKRNTFFIVLLSALILLIAYFLIIRKPKIF